MPTRNYIQIPGELTRDERAKLRALGGAAWIRIALGQTPMPSCRRNMTEATEAERARIIASNLPHRRIADELNMDVAAIKQLRGRVRRQAMSPSVVG